MDPRAGLDGLCLSGQRRGTPFRGKGVGFNRGHGPVPSSRIVIWAAEGAVATTGEDEVVRVVDEPVEDALSQDGIGEQGVSVLGRTVGDDDERAPALADEFP